MKRILITLLLFCYCCTSSETVKNQHITENKTLTNSASLSPSPTPKTKEEIEKEAKLESEAKNRAINDFIDGNYKGWKLQGVANVYLSNECEADEPCDLHLINGSQNKVITIIVKQFHKADGTNYWLVREARQIDLAKLKINEIKEKEKSAVLENLEYDDCSDICADRNY